MTLLAHFWPHLNAPTGSDGPGWLMPAGAAFVVLAACLLLRHRRPRSAGVVAMLLVIAAVSAAPSSPTLRAGATGGPSSTTPPATRAHCGPGSHPEPALQGQVPDSDLAQRLLTGYTCNLRLVGQYDNGGEGALIQIAWYGDCAYVNTLYAADDPEFETKRGLRVVDVSDPAHPVETARLQTPAMASTFESLKVHQGRGLLAATQSSIVPGGFPVLAPPAGDYFDIYDVSHDCREPRLLASVRIPGGIGHTGNFAPDGMTYYATQQTMPPDAGILPIDISDPTDPNVLLDYANPFAAEFGFHDPAIAEQGRVGYFTVQAGPDNGLAMLDLSDVQSRVQDPQIRTISQVAWHEGGDFGLAMAAAPARIDGRRYVFVTDEFGYVQSEFGSSAEAACEIGVPPWGYVQVVDVQDPAQASVVSRVQLEVNDPANCSTTTAQDKAVIEGAIYSSHYCAVDDPERTTALACAWSGSGVRVFDVRDPFHPREIAYYNPPPRPSVVRGNTLKSVISSSDQEFTGSNIRWHRTADGTTQLWFMSMQNGLQIVQFENGAYPLSDPSSPPARTGSAGEGPEHAPDT